MLSLHVFMFVNIFQVFLYINKYSQSVSVWLLAINVLLCNFMYNKYTKYTSNCTASTFGLYLTGLIF